MAECDSGVIVVGRNVTVVGRNVTVVIYIPSDQFNDTDGWVMHDHRRDDHTGHPRIEPGQSNLACGRSLNLKAGSVA